MGSVAYRKTNADHKITSRDRVTTSQRRGDITSQRPNRVMSDGQNRVTTSQNHLWPDHGLISAAGTSHNSLHQIRPLRRGTTARRFTQFRTDCVSHTEDVRTVRQTAPNTVPVNKSKSTWPCVALSSDSLLKTSKKKDIELTEKELGKVTGGSISLNTTAVNQGNLGGGRYMEKTK